MKRHLLTLILAGSCLIFSACQTAPPAGYAEQAHIVQKRAELRDNLIKLLPEEQRKLPQAIEEAQWLADTAYKGAAAIGRINKPERWPAWRNNTLVNSSSNRLERGLCWHYQHDMYRELRRRPLLYFNIGCCVRDEKTGSEHNCVYICSKTDTWPHVWVLDAWKNAGRLIVMDGKELDYDDWQDRPSSTEWLELVYPEGHRYPIEHWATVRTDEHWNKHEPSYTPKGSSTTQAQRMRENIRKGLEERNGNPISYSYEG